MEDKDSCGVSTGQFIGMLLAVDDNTTRDGCLEELKSLGVIDEQDILFADRNINRKRAATILHNYLRIVMNVRDYEDITSAEVLRDLYDCRVCVNHIAQVFLQGLMGGYAYLDDEPPKLMRYSDIGKEKISAMVLFEGEREIDYEEMLEIVGRVKNVK